MSYLFDVRLQEALAQAKRKCMCGCTSTIVSPRKEYAACNYCGRRVYRDPEKQREYNKKLHREDFRLKMWNTLRVCETK